ncbi:hypothetical protein GQ53DRAFT_758775 [Thozetella sp. PMI_491]|nr:hypothetical protein GQ53DRAFT_758775 [Thozetella sp. PMI_491]
MKPTGGSRSLGQWRPGGLVLLFVPLPAILALAPTEKDSPVLVQSAAIVHASITARVRAPQTRLLRYESNLSRACGRRNQCQCPEWRCGGVKLPRREGSARCNDGKVLLYRAKGASFRRGIWSSSRNSYEDEWGGVSPSCSYCIWSKAPSKSLPPGKEGARSKPSRRVGRGWGLLDP